MKFAFIVDPLEQLKAYKDSSIAMMRSAASRGHEIWTIQRPELTWRDGHVAARAVQVMPTADNDKWYRIEHETVLRLTEFDAVLMRQDPPFDAEYVAATWLLDRAVAAGARVWNRPSAIRDHSEKVALAEFHSFAPTTLIAGDMGTLQSFVDELKDVVVKPLDGMGGSGIFRVRHDDPNRNAILETITDNGRRSIMAQRYLPEILDGDKRILVIGGVPVPYSLARVPKAGELRGNLAAGGTGIARSLNERDLEIAKKLGPVLWARGLLIVGLDVIGDKLTEINVTSPTCFVEIYEQTGFDVAAMVLDVLERECVRSAPVSPSSSLS
jgi:glutathione synthase